MTSAPSPAALLSPVIDSSDHHPVKFEHISDEELSLIQNANELKRASFPNIEGFTNKLAEHKRNIHETAKQFPKYEPQTEDRSVSYLIFNNHIRNFQDVLIDFLRFVKLPGRSWLDKFLRDVPPKPQNLHCFDCPRVENKPFLCLFLCIRYDPTKGYDKELDTNEHYGAWVAKLESLMDSVWAEFKEMRYDFWLERDRTEE